MRIAFVTSIVFHLLLLSCLIWSEEISLAIFKKRQKELLSLEAMQVNLLYKPTDTAMKQGNETKDLPPPLVAQKAPEAPLPKIKEITPKKSGQKKKKKEEPKKQVQKPDLRKILESVRRDAHREGPPPKENNFPTTPKGEKGAHGTGGVSLRKASPAEQALQAAMRKYFELPEGTRKRLGQARGYIDIKLIGIENQFKIVSLKVIESSGFGILDQSCESAIRKSLNAEVFASDVISELNGKEHTILCYP